MKLTLDHTQRLNLHALLGTQRAEGMPAFPLKVAALV